MAADQDDPLVRLRAVQQQLQGMDAAPPEMDAETALQMLTTYEGIIQSAQGLLKSQLALVEQFSRRPGQDALNVDRVAALRLSLTDQVDGLEQLRLFLRDGDASALSLARLLMQRGADAASKLRTP